MRSFIKYGTMIILINLIVCSFSGNLSSQTKTNNIIGSEKLLIKSEILNEERTVLVSLPADHSDSKSNFPVLYVLDGNTHFIQASGACSYLSMQGIAPGIIVVAVTNVDRNRDFTSLHNEAMPTSGGGEKFHNFLKKELKPYIDKNYKTSGFDILMGHSLGGTFAVYSLLEYPDVFDAYIAVSPYLQISDNYLIDEAKKKLKKGYSGTKAFYMTVGDEPGYFKVMGEFSTLVNERSGDAISLKYEKMEGENHITTPYLGVFNGLRFIFSDWVLDKEIFSAGISAIDEHYKKISEKYNIEITTPEHVINLLGYNYLRAGKTEKAIEVFTENTKRFPDSPNVYDSLGEAYESNKQNDLAKGNYKKAWELGVEQKHVFTDIFKKNLERVSD